MSLCCSIVKACSEIISESRWDLHIDENANQLVLLRISRRKWVYYWSSSFLKMPILCGAWTRRSEAYIIDIQQMEQSEVSYTRWFHFKIFSSTTSLDTYWMIVSRRSYPTCPNHLSFGYISFSCCSYLRQIIGRFGSSGPTINKRQKDHGDPDGQIVFFPLLSFLPAPVPSWQYV